MKIFLIISIFLFVYISTESKKTLVIIQEENIKNTHSQFFNHLEKRGYQLQFTLSTNEKNTLINFGEYLYDNLIIMAPQTKSNSCTCKTKDLVEI
jgi:oligosaccharyltransferase complex subunit beta